MKALRTFLFIATAALFTLPSLYAQGKPSAPGRYELSNKASVFGLKTGPLKSEELLSPDFTIKGVAKNFRPENWLNLEAEVKFNLKANATQLQALGIGKNDKYFGPVVVTFHLLTKDPNSASGHIHLQKEVTYTDIPTDRPTYFSVLMSPVTISRLTGGTGSAKTLATEMGYEVKYKNDLIGVFSTMRGLAWWNKQSPTVTRGGDKYTLLNKNETPFAMLWWDRYPAIKTLDSTQVGESFKALVPDPEPEDGTSTPTAPTTPKGPAAPKGSATPTPTPDPSEE